MTAALRERTSFTSPTAQRIPSNTHQAIILLRAIVGDSVARACEPQCLMAMCAPLDLEMNSRYEVTRGELANDTKMLLKA